MAVSGVLSYVFLTWEVSVPGIPPLGVKTSMNFRFQLLVCTLGVSTFLSFGSAAQQPTARPLKQPVPLPLSVANSLPSRVQFLHPTNRAVHSLKAHNTASG